MKITFETKSKSRHWHKWFAWYPVLTRKRNNKMHLVWLSTVERFTDYQGFNEYRLIGEFVE